MSLQFENDISEKTLKFIEKEKQIIKAFGNFARLNGIISDQDDPYVFLTTIIYPNYDKEHFNAHKKAVDNFYDNLTEENMMNYFSECRKAVESFIVKIALEKINKFWLEYDV